MSGLINITSMLKLALETNNIYTGEIPETQTDPSVLVQFTTNSNERTIDGVKNKNSSMWRLTVVANTQSDIEVLTDLIDELDNTASIDYQRINTNMFNSEQATVDKPYCRAFYDLTVYNY